MDFDSILLAKKLSGGGGGGNQPKTHYEMGEDGFYMLYYGLRNENGNIVIKLSKATRRVYGCIAGDKEYIYDGTPTDADINFYPIPVPNGATRVEVKIAPTTQYMALNIDELNNNTYTKTYDSGWVTGGTISYTLNPNATNQYIVITSKYDSAGTSYPTNPTSLTVDFF